VPSGDASDLDLRHPSVAPADEEVAGTSFAADCLPPMVRRLPDAYRRAIELVEWDGVTQRAAAAREGISVSGMKARVQRARRHLKESLLQCCHVGLDARGGALTCETRRPGAMKENT
jgi:RNA polymerase sigma-70 factor (ECF subfamily)